MHNTKIPTQATVSRAHGNGLAMDELAKHSSALGIFEGDIKQSTGSGCAKEYAEIRFRCCACMKKRDRVIVYVNKKSFPVNIDEAKRKAAEKILTDHAKCLQVRSPAEKRTWLHEAQLAQEHEMAKKRKTELEEHATLLAQMEQLRKEQTRVETGRAIEANRSNLADFADAALQSSPAFCSPCGKRTHQPVSVFDTTPIVGSSTHRTRLHAAIHHKQNGLKGWVQFWACGSIRRYTGPTG